MKFLHSALRVTTYENAQRFYDDLLGLTRTKEATLTAELAQRIFGIDRSFSMIVYDCGLSSALHSTASRTRSHGGAALEVFVGGESEQVESTSLALMHVALEVGDRDDIVSRAREMGFPVTVIPRDGTYDLVFIRDADGNIFEIK